MEAVRIRQRGAFRVRHYPEKTTGKSRRQRLGQYVVSDVENIGDRVTVIWGDRKGHPIGINRRKAHQILEEQVREGGGGAARG